MTQNYHKDKAMKDNNLISEALAGLSPSAKSSSMKVNAVDGQNKNPMNSNTASTLKTVSTVNQEDPKQPAVYVNEPILKSTLEAYEVEGEVLDIVHLVQSYDTKQFLSKVDSGSGFMDYPDSFTFCEVLRGNSSPDPTEQKFYLPKSSIVSVSGALGIELLAPTSTDPQEILRSSSHLKLESLRESLGRDSAQTSSRRRGSVPNYRQASSLEPFGYVVEEIQANYDQTVISQGNLDTPSFTVPGETGSLAGKVIAKSDDFTFGKASVEESINPRVNESLVSSILINDKNESFNGSFEPIRKEGLKAHTQRSVVGEYLRGIIETQSNRDPSPKMQTQMLGKNGIPHLRVEFFGKSNSSALEHPRQYMTSRQVKSRPDHGSMGNNSVDYGYMNRPTENRDGDNASPEIHSERQNQTMESCDDSERFNLYRNGPVGSDTDEADFAYDIGGYPLSDRDSFMAGSSMRSDQHRKTIYSSRIEEIPVQVDANQFFLDDEVKSKYESLLQTTSRK